MSSQVTVTAPLGPGLSATSQTISSIRSLTLNPAPASILAVMDEIGKVHDFDIAATSTITVTISSGVITAVVAQ